MQLIKYLFLLLLISYCTLDIHAQGKAGYIVLLEGDTLFGNVKISRTKPVKFYQNGEKSVYSKKELIDYGYNIDGEFISRPEKIPPISKNTSIVDLVLTRGDTLYDCYMKKCDVDFLEVYIEYPKKEIFPVTEGKVKEIILYEDTNIIHIDAIHLKNNSKKGDFYPGYAVRAINGPLRLYHGQSPFSGTIWFPVDRASIPTALVLTGLSIALDAMLKADIDTWIVYKDGTSYRFDDFKQWEKVRSKMFADDVGFNEYLEENKYNQLSIETVLNAYNLYRKEKE